MAAAAVKNVVVAEALIAVEAVVGEGLSSRMGVVKGSAGLAL